MAYLGEMGVLYSVLYTFGVLLASPFVSRMFEAAVISQTYRIQTYLNDMTAYYATSLKTDKLTEESNSSDEKVKEEIKEEQTNNSAPKLLGESLSVNAGQ